MANSLIALRLRGYPLDHPVMQKGLRMLRSFGEETNETFQNAVHDLARLGYRDRGIYHDRMWTPAGRTGDSEER